MKLVFRAVIHDGDGYTFAGILLIRIRGVAIECSLVELGLLILSPSDVRWVIEPSNVWQWLFSNIKTGQDTYPL